MAPRRPRRRSSRSSKRPSSSSSSEEHRNWSELPPEILTAILLRLGAAHILTIAQNVCRAWRKVCKDPSMWRSIDMHNICELRDLDGDLETICRHAVDRSAGGLVDINVEYFGTNSLLMYIADRASNLRRLRIFCCYAVKDEGIVNAAAKLPLLEELEISHRSISGDALKAVGKSCPVLKTFKLKLNGPEECENEWDKGALAISQSMPQLHHLELYRNELTEIGLSAILDNCLHLEHLDLRQCFNFELEGDLEKRCTERIKTLKRPDDPIDDYRFDATINDWISTEGDYPYGFSDIDLLSDDDFLYDDFTAPDFSAAGFYDYDEYLNWYS